MALAFRDGVDKYEAIAKLEFHTTDRRVFKPIPPGGRVSVIRRGQACTDGQGRVISNGWASGALLANMLRHSWEIWAQPCVAEMRASGEEIPDEIRNILFVREGDRMRMRFNVGTVGHVRIRKGTVLKRGDPITSDMVLDFGPMNPPEWKGKPTPHVMISWRDKQLGVIFDLRPSDDDFPAAWDEETKAWYGRAHGEQFFAYQWGNVAAYLPGLTKHDLAFSVAVDSARMMKLARFLQGRLRPAAVELRIGSSFGVEDWKPLVVEWLGDDNWGRWAKVLEEGLKSYEHGLFHGCVASLVPVIEGRITAYVAEQAGAPAARQALAKRLDSLERILKTVHQGPVLSAQALATLHHLRHSRLYAGFSWDGPEEQRSRHALTHGQTGSYGNKANANRVFLLLSSLAKLLVKPEKVRPTRAS